MSIELLPFSAFALESCTAPSAAPGEAPTLTLQLAIATSRAGLHPTAGTMSTDGNYHIVPNGERAAILAADASPLTITFS